MADRKDQRETKQQDAIRDLGTIAREGDLLGRSGLRTATKRAADHFSAAEAKAENDPIELWGRRIGRVLGLIAFVGLAIYLAATYLR